MKIHLNTLKIVQQWLTDEVYLNNSFIQHEGHSPYMIKFIRRTVKIRYSRNSFSVQHQVGHTHRPVSLNIVLSHSTSTSMNLAVKHLFFILSIWHLVSQRKTKWGGVPGLCEGSRQFQLITFMAIGRWSYNMEVNLRRWIISKSRRHQIAENEFHKW